MIEDRDDERITALFVMARVYQQRKAVDSLMVMIYGSGMIKVLEDPKLFLELTAEHASSSFFSSRITKSVTVKVTKFVFLTATLLPVFRVVQSDKDARKSLE